MLTNFFTQNLVDKEGLFGVITAHHGLAAAPGRPTMAWVSGEWQISHQIALSYAGREPL